MSAAENLGRCEETRETRLKVGDMEEPTILRVSPAGKVEVERSGDPLPRDRAVHGVYVFHNGDTRLVAWKNTEAGAQALVQDLTSLGVTCYHEPISPAPPTSAQ